MICLLAPKFWTIVLGAGEQPPLKKAEWNLLRLAASSFSTSKFFEDCSGGNSRPSHSSGVGGGHFFPICLFWSFVVGDVSVTPKSTWWPPLTSFSGIKSLRWINLPFVRLRLLFPDSAAGAFFLSFGVFTLPRCWDQHPYQVSPRESKAGDNRYVCC